jgi:soluble lytic murein transglycosylase-like protein
MQSIAFCSRCRGMKIGWNPRYVWHCTVCKQWMSRSSKLLILTAFLSVLMFAFPIPSAFVFSDHTPGVIQEASLQTADSIIIDPAIAAMKSFLSKYQVDEANRGRIAESIVNSAHKYDVDPRLVASIMIIESRANPFAVSNGDSIGIMQIHLPTWGTTADEEGINLFKIEDNVDFGVRILKDYVHRFGLWDGVKRYKGLNPDNPDSAQAADDYVAKVQHIYSPAKPQTAQLLP